MSKRRAQKLADTFKALSNPNRLKVFEIIREGHSGTAACRNENRPHDIPAEAVCVCEIIGRMNVTPPTISHHLKELRLAGLVDVYQRGQWLYYAVREVALGEMADYFRREESVLKA